MQESWVSKARHFQGEWQEADILQLFVQDISQHEAENLGIIADLSTNTSPTDSWATKKPLGGGFLNLNLGGPCRARTYDPLIKSQLLYQLS